MMNASTLRRYSGAILVNLLALLLAVLVQPRLEPGSFVLFLMAVIYSSWYGGRIAGLLAVAFGVWAHNALLFSYGSPLSVSNSQDLIRVAVLVLAALLVSEVNGARSAQRRAEQSRALAEGQLRWLESVLDVMPIPLLLLDARATKPFFANRAARDFAGGEYPFIEPFTRERDGEERTGLGALASGDPAEERSPWALVPRNLAAEREGCQIAWQFPAGKRTLLVHTRLMPALPEHPATLVMPFQDLTPLKEAEEELRRSETRYRTLTEDAPVGIFHTDAGGGLLYVNDRWCALAGIGAEAAVGQGWLAAVHPVDRPRVSASWARAVAQGDRYGQEFRFWQPGRVPVWVYGQAKPLPDTAPGAGGYVGTATDITEQKEAQAELERLAEQRAQLAATVSHALRAPLAATLVNLDVLGDGTLGELKAEQRHYIERATRSLLHLSGTVDDLLAVERLRNGRVLPRKERVDLAELLDPVRDQMAPRAEGRDISLSVDLPLDLPEVETDRRNLVGIVTELIENGIKYGRPGGMVAVTGADCREGVRLTVADDGPGLGPEEVKQVFEPFYRGTAALEDQVPGTGLGLAIVSETAALLGISIEVESPARGGTAFHLVIPSSFTPARPEPVGVSGSRQLLRSVPQETE